MAKSKLSIQLHQSFVGVKASLADIKQTLDKGAMVRPEVLAKFNKQWEELSHASIALSNYLEKLQDRESSTKLPDRLRNLKNVFKNKEDLAQKRKATRLWYAELDKKIQKLSLATRATLSGQTPAQMEAAIKNTLAQISQWEAEVTGHDAAVDALEAALAI